MFTPRVLKLGKIQEIIAGQDSEIWDATVKVASNNLQYSLLHHPIQLLYPLEVHSQQGTPVDSVSDEPEQGTQSQEGNISIATPKDSSGQQPRRHSQRSAAKQANNRRNACMFELEK